MRTKEFSIFAFSNIGIHDYGFSKHWSYGFWVFETSQFCNLGFLHFDFIKHWNSRFFYFLNIQFFQYFDSFKHLEYWIFSLKTLEFSSCFGFSKYWNSGLWLSLNIGILDFGFFQTLELKIFVFRSLEFSILAVPDIGIFDFHFFNHNFHFSVLACPNIGIMDFGTVEQWNPGLWLFQTLKFFRVILKRLTKYH